MVTVHGAKEVPVKLAIPAETAGASRPAQAPLPARQVPAQAPKQRWWVTLLVMAVLGAIVYFTYPLAMPYLAIFNPPPLAPPPPRIVPVVTHSVDRADMNIYLNGLGTVTSFKTVTIRSRVDGELIKIAFTEGQMVRQGDLLAEIDPRPYQVQLKEAEAQLLRDKAALKLAQLDYARYEALIPTKAVTKQQLDAQVALVQQADATLKLDQSHIDNVKLQLTYCHITAPVDGRIGLRNVDLGNLVRANEPSGMAVITQLQPIAVVFTIPQDDVARVQQKMIAGEKLQVEAFDRELKTQLASGVLAAIDNQVDQTTGTVRLKAVFQNENNLLFPNQFVNGRLLIDTLHDAVVVPSAAVQRGPESMFAYVLKPDSTVDIRTLTLGPTEGDETVIESGLTPGETVVIDGVDKLQKGSKVAARDAGKAGDSLTRQTGDGPRAKGT